MAQRPYLLEVRAEAIALAEELFSAPLQAALALTSRTLEVAARLWELEFAAIVEQEREEQAVGAGDAEPSPEAEKIRISRTRSMRRAVPQVLNMMAGWLRDVMVAKSGRLDLVINRDHLEQAQQRAEEVPYDALRAAIDLMARTEMYIRYYVNPEPALQGMYVELADILAPDQTHADRARAP